MTANAYNRAYAIALELVAAKYCRPICARELRPLGSFGQIVLR
jgi:hypothetical protein